MNETPDPNKCGCRNLRCSEETGHKPGACVGAVATKYWLEKSGVSPAALGTGYLVFYSALTGVFAILLAMIVLR